LSIEDDFATYGGSNLGGGVSQPMFGAQPTFGIPSTFGASNFGSGYGGFGSDPLSGGGAIGFGQASKFGGIGSSGNPFGVSQPMGVFGGGGAIATDYVDLSNVKAPDINKYQPNKYATSAKSSLKKPGKKKDEPRGVSFGDVTTFHVDKESQLTETDKKSKSEDNDDDSDEDEDEDDIENNALANTLAESSVKEKKMLEEKKKKMDNSKDQVQPGSIAQMMKKINNIEESITESGSIGLKKSLESDDSTSKRLAKMSKMAKSEGNARNERSPTGLSDSEDYFHHKSQDLDSKKLSSEYDSAELSRNFNYEESEDANKFKQKFDKSKKTAEDETEYEEDFEASSNIHESSSMSRAKRSHDKDDIEDIRKRNMKSQSYLDDYNKTLKSQEEEEDEISKRLDSYRDKDDNIEDSGSNMFKASPKDRLNAAKISTDEVKMNELLRQYGEATSNSLEFEINDKMDAEIKAHKFQMDAQVNKMEAQNAIETNKLLKERILGYVQDINMYRVEIEALKRQVDIADSNASSKEVELKQVTEEYESKLKLEREKNAHSNIRQESREVNELKREIRLLKQAHEQEAQAKFEEIDYLTKR
jgi:hypothetical protein